jgi:hypothetical protein
VNVGVGTKTLALIAAQANYIKTLAGVEISTLQLERKKKMFRDLRIQKYFQK